MSKSAKRQKALIAKRNAKASRMKAKGKSDYAEKGKSYDYSGLFTDCPENQRANKRFKWTSQLPVSPVYRKGI